MHGGTEYIISCVNQAMRPRMHIFGLLCAYYISYMPVGFIHAQGSPTQIRIGGLFESENEGQSLAFQYAVAKLNFNPNILHKFSIIDDVQEVLSHDSFDASNKVCKQLKKGVAAIFGPVTSPSAAHVQSICDAMEIPHIQTRWDPNDITDYYSMNLYPHYATLSKAYADIISEWGWDKFTVLYEDNDGLIRLQDMLRASEDSDKQITVLKLEAINGNYIPLLNNLRDKGEDRIIVDCHVSKIFQILTQASGLGMMSQYFHFFFTTLDLELVNFKDFNHDGANVTAFRLIDPSNSEVLDVTTDWALEMMRSGKSPLAKSPFQHTISTQTALINDAVTMFGNALNELSKSVVVQTQGLLCSRTETWETGNSLLNYMKWVEFDGLSGHVTIDPESGQRKVFGLDVVKLNKPGLKKIGTWHSVTGVNITIDSIKRKEEVKEQLAERNLIVTSVLEDPYTMEKEPIPGHTYSGNDRYEGFAVDLLEEVSKILNFSYTIRIREDKKFGSPDENGEWNGMVKELIDHKADLAVAGMTITYRRERVIDFTKPFLNLGITILYKKPDAKPLRLFSFLSSFTIEVWLYMFAAYLFVSFMMFVMARFSPGEWSNPHPCDPNPDELENDFGLLNSLWFTIGCLMMQGSDLAPKAVSTRLVAGVWWFFALIMVSSYTANLAAFLTAERMDYPIESADDLSKQTKIQYGTQFSGSTKAFFETSEFPIFKRMWKYMSTHQEVFVNSSKEGVDRVLKGEYAYLAESTTVDYQVQRNCSLMMVGNLLDSKGYGIATPRKSPYRDLISQAILKLKEEQKIQKLYETWWKGKSGQECEKKDGTQTDDSDMELGIKNVGGVFLVMLGGLGLGAFIVVCEFIWVARKKASEDKQSIWSEMSEEFRFAVRCMGSSTRVVKRRVTENGVIKKDPLLVPLTANQPANGNVPGKDTYT